MTGNRLFSQLDTKWIQGAGPLQDVVLSSRVRLARNLRAYPFPQLQTVQTASEMLQKLQDFVTLGSGRGHAGNLQFLPLDKVSTLDRQVLVEKHLISPDLAKAKHIGSAVIVRDDEALSVMINEEDHLRIQCLLPGFQLAECWRLASRLDDLLEDRLDYAFDQKHGYLTACPTNAGTGLRASVMVHLPGLVISQQIGSVLAAISQVGLVVRGLYGEGTQASGNIFQISNQITLGPSEEEIISNLSAVIKQIVEQERASRRALHQSNRLAMEDKVYRAYGILTNARQLSSKEAISLLSDVRMGADMDIIPGLEIRLLNQLLVLIQPAMLERMVAERMNEAARDQKRAEVVRQKLASGK
ncbi:MAG: protein arginine kinase [Bacillota bacterium]